MGLPESFVMAGLRWVSSASIVGREMRGVDEVGGENVGRGRGEKDEVGSTYGNANSKNHKGRPVES